MTDLVYLQYSGVEIINPEFHPNDLKIYRIKAFISQITPPLPPPKKKKKKQKKNYLGSEN